MIYLRDNIEEFVWKSIYKFFSRNVDDPVYKYIFKSVSNSIDISIRNSVNNKLRSYVHIY